MSPLDTPAQQQPAEGRYALWPLSPRRLAGRPGAAARRAARIKRDQQRVEAGWSTRSKRERVRQTGERLVAAVVRLRAVEARMTLAEAGILTELLHLNQYESLGFVRQSDFAREALKLHPRTLRRRVALHRVLEAVPALEQPFLAGQVGVSQVLALRDVVTVENVTIWVNVAERLSVRDLQSLARRAKEKREAVDAGETDAENVVPGDAEGKAIEAGEAAETDPLEEPHRQRISFLAPQSAAFAIEHGLETAKRALGHEAPRDECLEAVLSEAESSLALPPTVGAAVVEGGAAPGNGAAHDPTVDTAESVVRPKVDDGKDTANGNPAADTSTTPYDGPVWYHKREMKASRRLLTRVDRTLARIDRLTERSRSGDGSSSGHDPSGNPCRLTAGALVDRYLALQQQKNPIRILIARALYHLSALGAGAMLGYENDLDMVARLAKVTPRSARDLVSAGFAFDYCPPLADAFGRGHLGYRQVLALSYEINSRTRTWIRRARDVTARQFRREVRLLRRLDEYTGNRPGCDEKAFPQPRLESTLRKRLFELGWKQEELDRELGERGILSPGNASTDPAENPALMARLETLLDMLALEYCRHEDIAPGIGKLLSVPGRHHRVTVWAKDPIARHWWDIEGRVIELCGNLPDWAVATLLFKAAQDEWDRTDPARVPTERRILDRDGYLCQAPGCSSRKNLEVHHIIFRSNGGSDDDHNLVTLCHQHHHHAVHRHTMRLTGEAPHNLTWEMGRDYAGYVITGQGVITTLRSPARWVYRGERLHTSATVNARRVYRGERPRELQKPNISTRKSSDGSPSRERIR